MTTYKTPLRYPGGKQRLWPFLDEILTANNLLGGHYVEPYAGGAGIAFELLLRKRVSHVHLNDSCIGVHAFWHSILNETENFCRKISRASLTVDEWKRQREVFKVRHVADRLDLGFAMFYLNRCNRSGILTGGVIGGLSQTGKWKIDARFPRNELITRIEAIAAKRASIKIRNWDAERFLIDYLPRLPVKTLVYCDPPYFHKADRLYPNHYKATDHARISKVIQTRVKLPWVVSYDSCPDVLAHYRERRAFQYMLQYNAARAYKGAEVFIFSDKVDLPPGSAIAAINDGLRAVA
ncbi:MAG: adenine methylase [Acidobacteria bacterium]|nr:adenine methylase [Acidobacteriota bacterium]